MEERSPLSVESMLVPVDGSDESTEAVEYAVAIASRYGAGLWIVYVRDETEVRAVEDGTVDEEALATDAQAYLDEVAAIATAADVPVEKTTAYGFSTRRKLQHPGSVVLDTAEEVGADFLVIPREPTDSDGVLAKTAEYVLLYASQPVLSV